MIPAQSVEGARCEEQCGTWLVCVRLVAILAGCQFSSCYILKSHRLRETRRVQNSTKLLNACVWTNTKEQKIHLTDNNNKFLRPESDFQGFFGGYMHLCDQNIID